MDKGAYKKRIKTIGNIIIILGFTMMIPNLLFTLGYMSGISMYSQVIRTISFTLIILGATIYAVANKKNN